MKDKVWEALGSYGLACALLCFLFVLTFLGTIEQVEHGLYEVQKKYFESLFLVHWAGGWLPLPLPGVYLVLIGLFLNLLVGGLIRIRKSTATVGVIVIHIGILLMLAAGFVKLKFSKDGHLRLYEASNTAGAPSQSDDYQNIFDWEVAIWDASQTSQFRELLIPQDDLLDLEGEKTRVFESPELPFKLEFSHYEKNCDVLAKGPMWQSVGPAVDGFALRHLPGNKEAEINVPGVYVKIDGKLSILHGFEAYPVSVHSGGRVYAVALRRKHYKMPFTITLKTFTHELYPNSQIPKVYASDVAVRDPTGNRDVKIEMNAPLRKDGLILFQADYGPKPDEPPGPAYSVFAVVENPSDQWPLWSCIIIAIGMALAFGQKLLRYIEVQSAERKA